MRRIKSSPLSQCTRRILYSEITKHFLLYNQTYLEHLIQLKGPFFALEMIKAIVGAKSQNSTIIKASIDVLQNC